MVRLKIPFESLALEHHHDEKRAKAVKRALAWCEALAESTGWDSVVEDGVHSLHRTINGNRVDVLPLLAAEMDLGHDVKFAQGHLPVYLNGEDACVRSLNSRAQPLHTDMVASIILLLGSEPLPLAAIPTTLHALLSDEERAMVPVPTPRPRYEPGRPSTSGRIFLPEDHVLEGILQGGGEPFVVQFEKRDGTLRNMTARYEPVAPAGEATSDSPEGGRVLPYDPATYSLVPVMETTTNRYRLVAYDRVTFIAVDGQTHQTESYAQP